MRDSEFKRRFFKTKFGNLPLPIFFPDATRGVIRTLDSADIESTKTKGILVNTFHLWRQYGDEFEKKFGDMRSFMSYKGGMISDSGGFQVGSLIKKNPKLGFVGKKGATFTFEGHKKLTLTPEASIRFQMSLGVDMVVALDDFDSPDATEEEAKVSVERTILWAKRSKDEFEKICAQEKLSKAKRPYILGVIQGARSKALRKFCAEELIKIGFDGLGYGGEEKIKGGINYDLAKFIAELVPKNYFLYALGVGKPEDVVMMTKLGYGIFDCVLPTRDARHKRLYTYNAETIKDIDLTKKNFYSYYVPDRSAFMKDTSPVSLACDCLLCKKYSKAYLYHLFKIKDVSAMRLATIHNLRFYSILMEKLSGHFGKYSGK